MPLRHIILDKTYRAAWSRTLQLWKPLAVWTLLVWLVLTVIFIPATTALVHMGFIRGDRLVISNEEIASFFLTPAGSIFILLLGSLTIIGSIIRFSGIYQIVTCEMKQRPLTVKELVIQIVPTVPRMFRLALFFILLAFFAGAVLFFGLGIIYWILLSGQDMNYYLSVQPPEWTYSIIAGGFWLLISSGTVLYLLGRISVALPAFHDSNITIRQAISNSWKIMGGHSVKLLKMLGFTFAAWFLLLMITEAFLLSVTLFTIDQLSSWISHPRTVTSVAGTYIIMSQVVSSIIGFFGFSFISVLLTKFYHEDSVLKYTAPPAPKFTELRIAISKKISVIYTPLRAGAFILILFVTGIGTGAYLAAQIPVTEEIKILAHRTGPPPAPENTLAALELSIEQGADVAEIDVMRTADGTVIVFHDRDLMRMARDPRKISAVTYPEIELLEQIPAGGFPLSERRISTLEEILLRGKDRIEFMIELKYYDYDPLLADEVTRTIEETGMENQTSVASLQIDPLQYLSRAGSEIPIGYISAISIGNLSRLPVQYIAVQHQQINGTLMRNARQNDNDVYAWTVNTPERVSEMINLGVDGIITDNPKMARSVADEMRDLTLPQRFLLNITGWQSQRNENKNETNRADSISF